MSQDINVLALVKGGERYVFLTTTRAAGNARTLVRYAESGPESRYDAAVLSQKIRQESQKHAIHRRFQVSLPTDTDEIA